MVEESPANLISEEFRVHLHRNKHRQTEISQDAGRLPLQHLDDQVLGWRTLRRPSAARSAGSNWSHPFPRGVSEFLLLLDAILVLLIRLVVSCVIL